MNYQELTKKSTEKSQEIIFKLNFDELKQDSLLNLFHYNFLEYINEKVCQVILNLSLQDVKNRPHYDILYGYSIKGQNDAFLQYASKICDVDNIFNLVATSMETRMKQIYDSVPK